MKIGLINVRYSPNLGDGLLAECLEAELSKQLGDARIVTADLAGRTGYVAGNPWRGAMIRLLLAMPAPIRKTLTRFMLSRLARRLRPRFRELLSDCDVVVLGGGNLLADSDLNFPMKIAAALESTPHQMPLAVYAVGASRNWSAKGAKLFERAFASCHVILASVRDDLSRGALAEQMPSFAGKQIHLVKDPGLLAARHYPRAEPSQKIGICVTDPFLLRYHGGTGANDTVASWIEDLTKGLAQSGHQIEFFTNGSPEDVQFLNSHYQRWLAAAPDKVSISRKAEDPSGLMRIISSYSLIIAHRMHACIAAYSYGIPVIGLTWDPKLSAFFDLAGMSDCLFSTESSNPKDVATKVESLLLTGLDHDAHRTLLDHAANDVSLLAERLKTKCS